MIDFDFNVPFFYFFIDSTGEDTVEGSGIRMDDAESLSLSQFPRERRCVCVAAKT